MIVIFKNNANPEQVKQLCAGFEAQGLKIHNSEGEHTHLIDVYKRQPAGRNSPPRRSWGSGWGARSECARDMR